MLRWRHWLDKLNHYPLFCNRVHLLHCLKVSDLIVHKMPLYVADVTYVVALLFRVALLINCGG